MPRPYGLPIYVPLKRFRGAQPSLPGAPQPIGHLTVAPPFSQLCRIQPLARPHTGGRSVRDEPLDHRQLTRIGCCHKGRPPFDILVVDIGTPLDEELCGMKMSLGSSDQQRRLPLVIDNIDPRAMVQQPRAASKSAFSSSVIAASATAHPKATSIATVLSFAITPP